MPEDLAIFMDWENIYISTVTEYNSKPNVSAILEKAQEYGRIVSSSAYADWTDGDFRGAPPTLYSNGISPRYISARYFPGGKSQKRRTNSIDGLPAQAPTGGHLRAGDRRRGLYPAGEPAALAG
jgi:hypothetical protein